MIRMNFAEEYGKKEWHRYDADHGTDKRISPQIEAAFRCDKQIYCRSKIAAKMR